MSIKNYTVPLPDKRISLKTVNGTKYVYYITEYYKTENGFYTNKSASIGKLDAENPSRFFPNDNYFKYFGAPEEDVPVSQFTNAGNTVFLAKRFEQLGVTKIIQKIFPEDDLSILQTAIYMLCRGNVLLYMDDFYDKNFSPYGKTISQKKIAKVYEVITKEKRWEFFQEWKKQIVSSDEYIAYDVTSISSYAKEIPFAEKGYNRDHEMLPQVNLGMFFSQHQQLPVCYELYNGSLTDQTFLSTMMEIAEEFQIRPFLYVMDKGFLNTANVTYLFEKDIPFLLSAPTGQEVYKKALLSVSKRIRNLNHYIEFAGVFGTSTSVTIDEKDYTLFCYFDSEKAKVEENTLFQEIKEREKQLDKQINRKKRKKREPFFDVEVENEKITRFSRDEQAIQEAFDLIGMFAILTNQSSLTASEALAIYRKRNDIEAHYDSMKNTLDFDRFHTHNQQTTEGKFFIGFLAQILQADLLRTMNPLDKKPVPTTKGLLLELEKIQRVQYKGRNRLMAPLTKKQKDILNVFNLSPEEFIEDILNSPRV